MSYSNFIPTVWAAGIQRELERNCVFAEDCHKEYEGKVSEAGDTVKIVGIGKPTIIRINRGESNKDIKPPEIVEDSSVNLTINQIAYFNFMVGDIDKRQSKGNVTTALRNEASEGLANEIDKYLAGFANAKNTKKLNTTPTVITKDNVLGILDEALTVLYKNDVKQTTPITITISPDFFKLFRQAYQKIDTNNSRYLKNGFITNYNNAIIKMSNNIVKKDGVEYMPARTKRAQAFVNPMTHTEAYRPEAKFADAIKGFTLFDSLIVRPKEYITINCKYS